MYANLLMQLRHQGITTTASNDSEVSVCGGQQNNSSNHSNSLEIGNSDRNNASSPDGHSSPSSSTCSKGGLISEDIHISVRSSFKLTKWLFSNFLSIWIFPPCQKESSGGKIQMVNLVNCH